jgi:hypothetical protein
MPAFAGTATTGSQLDNDTKMSDGMAASGNHTVTFAANITGGDLSGASDGAALPATGHGLGQTGPERCFPRLYHARPVGRSAAIHWE